MLTPHERSILDTIRALAERGLDNPEEPKKGAPVVVPKRVSPEGVRFATLLDEVSCLVYAQAGRRDADNAEQAAWLEAQAKRSG